MKHYLELVKKRNNPQVGIVIIISSLLMILSLLIFSYGANPLYLIQAVTLIPILGEMQTLLIWVFITLFATLYYMGVEIPSLTSKKMIAVVGATFAAYWFIITFVVATNYADYSFVEFYKTTFTTHMDLIFNSWTTNILWSSKIIVFINTGFLLPIVLFSVSVWCYGIIGGIIFALLFLYFIYVIYFGEFQIYIAKLYFWKNEDKNIEIRKEIDSLDLNVETKEFELNFTKEEKEKIDLIQRVRKNMDTKNYEELSKKIKEEKERIEKLKERILIKTKENKADNDSRSKLSEEHKKELMLTLGQSSYSQIKAQSEKDKLDNIKTKEMFSETPEVIKEEIIEEGFESTEKAYDISEKDLSESFVDDIVNELYKNFDPTQEVPLIQDYYADIFENDDDLEKEILKTLETNLDFKEESSEVIIENIEQEITVEEYLSIPDEISSIEEKTQETIINIVQKTQEENIVVKADVEESVWEEEEETIEEEIKVRPLDWCKPFTLPSTSILSSVSNTFDNSKLVEESSDKAKKLNDVFSSFNINATVNSFDIGPTITTFKIELESGIKTTKVTNLEDNLKLTLGAEYIRIIAPIPGTSFIGIEVPNSIKKPVLFKTVFDATEIDNSGILISIGQDVSGRPLSFDLTKAPHLLVAGSTGSGKSVAINTILASIIFRYKPTEVQLILIDPKMVEFAPFHGIPHLLAEVITDPTNANSALKAMVDEMERRYKLMAEKGAKKLEELNEKLIAEGENKLPYIVIVIDELADLMMTSAKEVEESIMRITQKARAAGIHMIVATQRPSTEIITGTIKSNIPSRMAFTVASSIDSRTILGQIGAEKLIGMGDMLISLYGKLPVRGQGAFISNNEIEELTAFVKTQCDANYMIDIEKFSASLNIVTSGMISTTDPMYIAAKDTVIHYQKASTSMLQRHLNIGYNKAANIIETLEAEGVVGKAKGSRPREVLVEI